MASVIDPDIFKAYDVRGIYPTQINEEAVYDIIQAYTAFLRPKRVILAKDVRLSGPQLFDAAKNSFLYSGVDVIDIGTVPTDAVYLAITHLGADGGITVSASHNPRDWNGLNMSRKGAKPISSQSGLLRIRELSLKRIRISSPKKGKLSRANILDAYADFVLSFIEPATLKRVRLVADGSFGTSVEVLRKIVKRGKIPLRIIGINDSPDGNFPKGDPNPLLPENRKEISRWVKRESADLGVAWDGDGDRCFFVDEKGNFIEGYFITALLARELLEKHPGEKVIIDPRLVWASIDAITSEGGIPVISKPGMTIIAERMEKEAALFAGEMSSHFYFRENANRDNGMIPLFLILGMMSKKRESLSMLVESFTKKYFVSGEINFPISNAAKLLKEIEGKYKNGLREHIDGLSVEYPQWRFNLRASNTEPLVRLNIEARQKTLVREKVRELSLYIKHFQI